MTAADQRQAASRAAALIDLHRTDEAIRLLTSALAAEPQSPRLLCLLAQARLAADQPVAAREAAQAALAVTPDNEWAHRLTSIAASRLEDHPAAIWHAQQAVALHPNDWRPHARLAMAFADSPTPMVGWEPANNAVALAPDEAEPHFAMGYVAMHAGDRAVAEQAYRKVLEIDPQHAGALNNLAIVDLRAGRLRRATSGLGAALLTDPDIEVAQRNLDVVAQRYFGRVHRVVWLVLILLWLTSGAGAGNASDGIGHGSTGLRLTVAGLAGAVLVGLAVASYVVDSRLPANLRGYYRRMPLRDRTIGLWLLVDIAALLLLAINPLLGSVDLSTIAVISWALLWVGVGLSYLHVRQLRNRFARPPSR